MEHPMKWIRWGAVPGLVAWCLAGCDPFAPVEPEPPIAGVLEGKARSAAEVPLVFGRILTGESAASPRSLTTSDILVVDGAGSVLDDNGLVRCVESFGRTHGGAVAWTASYVPEVSGTDSARGKVEYQVGLLGGARLAHGSADWTMVPAGPSEWRLARWEDDPLSDSSWLDLCRRLP